MVAVSRHGRTKHTPAAKVARGASKRGGKANSNSKATSNLNPRGRWGEVELARFAQFCWATIDPTTTTLASGADAQQDDHHRRSANVPPTVTPCTGLRGNTAVQLNSAHNVNGDGVLFTR